VTLGMPFFSFLNKIKITEIKNSFIELGEEIIKAIQAIPVGKDLKEAQMNALDEEIDLNSYRLDAWITSLAIKKITACWNFVILRTTT
jgi:hypothetical protein